MPIEIKEGKQVKVMPNRVRLILEEEGSGKILEECTLSSSGECSVRIDYDTYRILILTVQRLYSNRLFY